MTKQIHMNAFTMFSFCFHSKGQWKHPLDRSSQDYKDDNYWVDLARTLERGCFNSLFIADVHGSYNVYKGSRDTAVRHVTQIPSNDPTLVISAMAYATKHVRFVCTFSTSYFAPYQTAKLFSTLDHLTNGRIAWNIVTSYLPDANANFGIGGQMEHDQRYDRADEYMAVVYKLWEHSWEEDAVVRDVENDIHTDPAKVHEINHKGEYFDVPGPHMCEPSLQRTPVLYQAGGSGRGIEFAARHAEGIFAIHPNIKVSSNIIQSTRETVAKEGRDPYDVKIFPGISVIVAPTNEEAEQKYETCKKYMSPEGALALYCGWVGVDLSVIEPGKDLESVKTNAIQGLLSYFSEVAPGRKWTLQEAAEFISIGSVMPKIIGNSITVADELERWMDETDCDGFNLVVANHPTGYIDFVDLVVPELQRRGRMRTHYETKTLREHYFGTGRQRLPENHVAYRTLPEWKLRSENQAA